MPQMSPLPWVGLWVLTLGLIMLFLVLIFYSAHCKMKFSVPVEMNEPYSWKW